ncbi:MAG: YbhB/YbcL family Raf kinase inhibitor-like protein [Candidatus Omnitrophota bacterium]
MRITSPVFENDGVIPVKFTCDGDDINPELIIDGPPQGAQTLALIVDDPDAPSGTWVHWLVFDIPVVSRIAENSIPGIQGVNDFGKKNYGGPCPPRDTHRYFFRIFALDKKLGLKDGINRAALEKAMWGHVLDKAELFGLYMR